MLPGTRWQSSSRLEGSQASPRAVAGVRRGSQMFRNSVTRNRFSDPYFCDGVESSRAVYETLKMLVIEEFIVKEVIDMIGSESG